MFIQNKLGLKLYVETLNLDKKGDAIFFLNGVMASVNSWGYQRGIFEDAGFRLVFHDFINQLRSDKSKETYTLVEHCEDLMLIMDELGIESAHLIGTSYGGEVALKMAIEFPARVKTISIIDSTSETDALMVHQVRMWQMMAMKLSGEDFFLGILGSVYGEKYLREYGETLKKRALGFNDLPKDYFSGLCSLIDTFINDVDFTWDLTKITSKALVVCGEDDILKPVRYSKQMAKIIPDCELVILPECGHVAIYEATDALNSCLLGFVMKNRGSQQ
jgi:3-oxoadipate enol-lactonase